MTAHLDIAVQLAADSPGRRMSLTEGLGAARIANRKMAHRRMWHPRDMRHRIGTEMEEVL